MTTKSQLDPAARQQHIQRIWLHVTRWVVGVAFGISLVNIIAFFTITSLYPQAHGLMFWSVALAVVLFLLWRLIGRKLKSFDHMELQKHV